jgi:SprT protein
MPNIDILLKYLPEKSHEYVTYIVKKYPAHIHISNKRNTKLGDFRPSSSGDLHRISVNFNLNPYSFLITLIHEFAHLINWDKYKNKVKPHGQEWKYYFAELMQPLLMEEVFPENLYQVLKNYMDNPSASSCSDRNLMLILRTFDKEQKHYLCDLNQEAIFRISSGKTFIKKEKRRKYFTCIELHSGRKYLVNELAEVELINGTH